MTTEQSFYVITSPGGTFFRRVDACNSYMFVTEVRLADTFETLEKAEWYLKNRVMDEMISNACFIQRVACYITDMGRT